MSLVAYNDVTLPYASTTQFRQEAWNGENGVDRIGTKFDIVVQGVINANFANLLIPEGTPTGNDASPANLMRTVRNRLLAKRKRLSFKFNGVEMIPNNGLVGTVDAYNGPDPQSCDIIELNNTTFLFVYHIIAHYIECTTSALGTGTSASSLNPVIYNRWTETVDIDNRDFSTRTRTGTVMIRSDNVNGQIVDQLRAPMAVVGIPAGFLRQSSQYTTSPDGLKLQYRIVDREQYIMPPEPAFEADGEYIESISRKGAFRTGEARVRLRGSKNSDKTKLIETALAVCVSKVVIDINDPTKLAKGFSIPDSSSIRCSLYDNEVEARIRVLMKPRTDVTGKARYKALWGYDFQGMAKTIPVNPPIPPNTVRGSASLLLQAAAYYDPCLVSEMDCLTGQMTVGVAPGNGGIVPETAGASVPGTPFSPGDNVLICQQGIQVSILISDDINPTDLNAQYQNIGGDRTIFTDYQINNRYEGNKHIYMMPLTSPTPIGGSPGDPDGQGSLAASFVQLALPTLLWIVEWTASRFDAVPEIPNPTIPGNTQLSAQKWVFMHEQIDTADIQLAPDGVTPLYRISGVYVYGNTNPNNQTIREVRFGRPPWMLDNFNRSVPTSTLTANLMV